MYFVYAFRIFVPFYSLNDEEELTHLGQSLSSITKFDDALVSDDEDGTLTGRRREHANVNRN